MRESISHHHQSATILLALMTDLDKALGNIEQKFNKSGIYYYEKVVVDYDKHYVVVNFFDLYGKAKDLDVNEVIKSELTHLGFEQVTRKKFQVKYIRE